MYVLFINESMDITMKTRRFKGNACNHIYQRTIDGFNVFYDLCDYLTYYTIFSTIAMKYDVVVWGLCLMIDHIHILVSAPDKETLSNFVSNVTSVFVRQYNADVGRKGPLFEERFGSAPKMDEKRLRSAIIYLANNPVEKRLCGKAEEYRWNFIAYMGSDNPFSDKLIKRTSRSKLKKALAVVDWYRNQKKYLTYGILHESMLDLTPSERRQLTDYIIMRYNVIAYDKLLKIFDSYEQLLVAVHSTTGSEYDLTECIDKLPDSVYRDMIICLQKSFGNKVRRVTVCTSEEKFEMAVLLRSRTFAAMVQIFKFLHLKVKKA